MNIQLSDHFTYRRLIRFTISTVLMLICTSMYSIVDGLFVSNYVGKMPFAATNLIWPVSMGIAAIGFMLGTGGSAIVAKTLGEGKKEKANQYFSMILYFGIIVSVIFSVICFIFTPQIARMLKADGELWNIASYTEEFFLRRRRRLFCRICFKAFSLPRKSRF